MVSYRGIKVGSKIPKGLLIQDIERGASRRYRVHYSYCIDCGRVIEGWNKFCYCSKRGKEMKKSWSEVNWDYLVAKMGIRERHNLPFKWGNH